MNFITCCRQSVQAELWVLKECLCHQLPNIRNTVVFLTPVGKVLLFYSHQEKTAHLQHKHNRTKHLYNTCLKQHLKCYIAGSANINASIEKASHTHTEGVDT